jgi:hypothetical protein
MTTRVFVPLTRGDLLVLARDQVLPPPAGGVRGAHASTSALQASWPDGDEEEWEYAALLTAAQESLELVAAAGEDVATARRRVAVLDVAATVASPDPEAPETGVGLAEPLRLHDVDAWHVDDDEAAATVAAAVTAIRQDAGDEDLVARLEACLEHDLGWYARQELDQLI